MTHISTASSATTSNIDQFEPEPMQASHQYSWNQSQKAVSDRRATATVELAVALPALIVLVFGSIEAANFIHLKQDVSICTYEAAKVAASDGNVNQDVVDRFTAVAAAKGISGASVTISPTLTANTPSGTQITLTGSATADTNYELPMSFFNGQTIRARVVMVRVTN